MGSNYQEDATEENLFVGLAKLCSRACLVLDAVTRRREADGLGDLSHKSKVPKGVFISLIFSRQQRAIPKSRAAFSPRFEDG